MLCSSWGRNDAPLITANQSNGSLDLRDGIEASESSRNEAVPASSSKWPAGKFLDHGTGLGSLWTTKRDGVSLGEKAAI